MSRKIVSGYEIDSYGHVISDKRYRAIYVDYYSRSKFKGMQFSLSYAEFESLLQQNCNYCGMPPCRPVPKLSHVLYNGIDRVNNNLGYIQGNCVACCTVCNIAKRSMSEEQFKDWVQRVYAHLFGMTNNDETN